MTTEKFKIIHGDSIEKLKDFSDNHFDAVITDPPYGINFLNYSWDYDIPKVELWLECYRVLKSGQYLLSFSSPRTYHKIACEVESAGFEIVDQMMWIYSTGMTKSVKKLKPAHEPIIIARKPGPDKGFNIDDCRIPWDKTPPKVPTDGIKRMKYGQEKTSTKVVLKDSNPLGRHPSNVIGDFENFEIQKYFYAPRVAAEERAGNTHPTPKPISLMSYLIKLVSKENDLILDPFCGSGSTGVACLNELRNFIGIEINIEYCEIAQTRLDNSNVNKITNFFIDKKNG